MNVANVVNIIISQQFRKYSDMEGGVDRVYLCVSILAKAIPSLISSKFVHTALNRSEVVGKALLGREKRTQGRTGGKKG